MTSVPGIQLAGLSSSLATPGSGRFFTKNRFLRWKVASVAKGKPAWKLK
jgi:hypothetical protein